MNDQDRSRVLIRLVDDDDDVREAAAFMLSCKGGQVASWISAAEVLANDAAGRPGCLVLDIRMPGMSGLELQTEMRRRSYTLPIIFLTGHGSVDTAVKTLRRGAFDFLQKPVDNDVLLASIEKACQLSLVRSRGELTGEEASQVIGQMSERERQILDLISGGLDNRGISSRLGIAERTVQGHRNNIYHKLRVHNDKGLIDCIRRLDSFRNSDM